MFDLTGMTAPSVPCSYGAVCQRFYTKLPTISLYTTATGAIIAAGCVAMSVTSHLIAGNDSDKG